MKPWKKFLIITLVFSAIFHVTAIKAIPYVVMTVVKKKLMEREGVELNAVAYQKMVTEDERVVVRPSPDVLYSGMVFDVSTTPLLITATVKKGKFWSLNFHDMKTDSFGVFDDRGVKGGVFKIILANEDTEIENSQGIEVLRAPVNTGVMLSRLVIPDRSVIAEYQKLQHTLKVTAYIE